MTLEGVKFFALGLMLIGAGALQEDQGLVRVGDVVVRFGALLWVLGIGWWLVRDIATWWRSLPASPPER